MIKARRLFLVPVLASFLIFIPIFGILLMLIVWFIWYINEQKDIHAYFRGIRYELKDDFEDKKELEKLR